MRLRLQSTSQVRKCARHFRCECHSTLTPRLGPNSIQPGADQPNPPARPHPTLPEGPPIPPVPTQRDPPSTPTSPVPMGSVRLSLISESSTLAKAPSPTSETPVRKFADTDDCEIRTLERSTKTPLWPRVISRPPPPFRITSLRSRVPCDWRFERMDR